MTVNAAVAMDAPSAVVVEEEDVFVRPTPMQTAAREKAVVREMVLER